MTPYTSETSSDTQSHPFILNTQALANSLDGLLKCCTVKIRGSGHPRTGTGFFVAPGLILTCSHFLPADSQQPVTVIWRQQLYSAFIFSTPSSPAEALTLLQIRASYPAHPYASLEGSVQPSDLLYGYGYSDEFPEGVASSTEVESVEDHPALLRLRLMHTRSHLSGSPLLNWRTGKVCGMATYPDLGPESTTVAIPATVILRQFPDLVMSSQPTSQHENQWDDQIHTMIVNQYQVLGSSEGVVLHQLPTGQLPTLTGLQPDTRPGYGVAPLIDRQNQRAEALDALRSQQSVELYGPDGYGKTTLLQSLVAEIQKTAPFPDGVVYESVSRRPPEDLLQSLFNQLCAGNTLVKVGSANSTYYLRGLRALIVLDDIAVSASGLNQTMTAMPGSTFLLATPERMVPESSVRSIALGGLPIPDSLTLVEQRLGQPLTAEEQPAAAQLCATLQGSPARILQSVALVKQRQITQGQSLGQALTQVNHRFQTETMLRVLLSDLDPDQRLVLTALTAFAGLSLLPQQVADLTGISQAEAILQGLLERHLLTIQAGRYQLTADLVHDLQAVQLPPWREHLLTYFTNWAELHRTMGPALLAEAKNLLTVLEWAVSQGQWREVLSLVRSIESSLIMSGQWQTWEQVLQWGLQATQTLGDLEAEAWALHQLGSRALSLGMTDPAKDLLNQSLHWRQTLGDEMGIAVTRHNLNLLQPALPVLQEVPVSQSVVKSGRFPLTAGVLLVLAGAIGVVGSFWLARQRPAAISSKSTSEALPAAVTSPPVANKQPASPEAAVVSPSRPLQRPVPSPPAASPTSVAPPAPTTAPSPLASPAQASILQFSHERLGYGNVSLASGGLFRTLTVTNTGPGPVTIQTIALSGNDASNFEIESMPNSCKNGLVLGAPGDSCQIRIFLIPQDSREYQTNVVITHTGADSPRQIELKGNGVNASAPNATKTANLV
ncbi:MAG: trypsin-like peptidase domain-containing protein [Leptolyngbyaceae cyanobacterium]